jgi:hypothetical protein
MFHPSIVHDDLSYKFPNDNNMWRFCPSLIPVAMVRNLPTLFEKRKKQPPVVKANDTKIYDVLSAVRGRESKDWHVVLGLFGGRVQDIGCFVSSGGPSAPPHLRVRNGNHYPKRMNERWADAEEDEEPYEDEAVSEESVVDEDIVVAATTTTTAAAENKN